MTHYTVHVTLKWGNHISWSIDLTGTHKEIPVDSPQFRLVFITQTQNTAADMKSYMLAMHCSETRFTLLMNSLGPSVGTSLHSPPLRPPDAPKWRCLCFCSRCHSADRPRTPRRTSRWTRWTSWTASCARDRPPRPPCPPAASPGRSRLPPGWWWPAVRGAHPSRAAVRLQIRAARSERHSERDRRRCGTTPRRRSPVDATPRRVCSHRASGL